MVAGDAAMLFLTARQVLEGNPNASDLADLLRDLQDYVSDELDPVISAHQAALSALAQRKRHSGSEGGEA